MTTINEIPTNLNQELNRVHNHTDKAKLEKTLMGTECNIKHQKENFKTLGFNPKRGWKNSRAYKGKNFSDAQRIEYIKEKKRKQSESEKRLNKSNPSRNEKTEEAQPVKNDEKVVISQSHNRGQFRGGRSNRR
jgi:hypothetical protein